MRMPIPNAQSEDAEAEAAPVVETPRMRQARLAASAAARTAGWRARRAEEEAALRKQAARDAAIVDAVVMAGYVAETVAKKVGSDEVPTFGIRDVMRIARDRLETLGMSRTEALRQLHMRLAPSVECPF
ncbi:hypothetical protein GOFOIKOB_5786 [Methylobacterium tardum]|uniref:Uncharacterized protein n=1 Tax=Methylobacterium tardum TaxID=374432 RepID=A0AA37TE95_9HYPH|nr:hypothetical protein [Methylobacterium tardum]URD39566.1 hypothetical protein M6G65_14930 [Methylobacterium tardum]GJE52712.1 hypothetical protein GOFOIKOB_5786 [Methylobacterium tardum]GLS68161.1 hypothetical protein GCM10007890_01730 [Methylobacterium tardum]